MNPILYAVKQVRFRIPPEVLDTVFTRRDLSWRRQPESLDSHILNLVIRPRLLADCQLIGGTEMIVPLMGLEPVRINNHTYVYRIPKERTQGRSITSALNITYSDPTSIGNIMSGNNGQCQSSFMLDTAQQLVDSAGLIPITGTSNVQLVGENCIMVRETATVPLLAYLRCIVANDENMNHVQIRSYRHFADAAVLCTKAYIYNQYIVYLDIGEIQGGASIGRLKEIIESYSDAEELYQTFLTEKLQKVMFMNDHTSYNRFLKLVGGGWR